jgi:hypothetical protein
VPVAGHSPGAGPVPGCRKGLHMRRTVILLVMATILSLHLAVGVANAGTLKVKPNPQSESGPSGAKTVTISGTTGCSKAGDVYVRSLIHSPGSKRRAITGRPLPIESDGSFKGGFTVRSTAVGIKRHHYPLVSTCGSAGGDPSGKTYLWVLPYTGLPVLPQLLGGVGLIASGAAMVRRGRTGPRNRPRTATLTSVSLVRALMVARRGDP